MEPCPIHCPIWASIENETQNINRKGRKERKEVFEIRNPFFRSLLCVFAALRENRFELQFLLTESE